MKTLAKWLFLGLLSSCSAMSALQKDGEPKAKDDSDPRPSDETEGVLGYLRNPDLVTFERKDFQLTVTGVAGSVVAEDLDVRTLFVHVIQLPVEELATAQATYQSTLPSPGSSGTEPGDAIGQPSQPEPKPPLSAPDEPTSGSTEPFNPDSQSGSDAPQNGEDASQPPPDDGLNLVQHLQGFSPAELIVKGRIRGTVRPEADGSFVAMVTLTRPDPVVVVVGQFDAIDLITVKDNDDPRISTIIYSPATNMASGFLDTEFLQAFDAQAEAVAVEAQAEEWASAAPEPIDYGAEEPGEAIEPVAVPTVEGEPDPELEATWNRRCYSRGDVYMNHDFTFYTNGTFNLVTELYSDDKCATRIGDTHGGGEYGTLAVEGAEHRRLSMVLTYVDIVVYHADPMNQRVSAKGCGFSSWQEGQPYTLFAALNQIEPSQCNVSAIHLGEVALALYQVATDDLRMSKFQYDSHDAIAPDLPLLLSKVGL